MKTFKKPNGAFFPEEMTVIKEQWSLTLEIRERDFFADAPYMRLQGWTCEISPFEACVWDPSDPNQSFLNNECIFCGEPEERQ